MKSKVVKMKCQKYKKYFCAELKQNNGIWKVVNFIPINSDEYSVLQTELKIDNLMTDDSLLACRRCGSRRISGCSCSYKFINCCDNDKYDFNCIYCDKIEVDYSLASKKTPYNQWAGISNIPNAIKDKYGNPFGSQYDLIADGSFDGKKIMIINLCTAATMNGAIGALKTKGFDVDLVVGHAPEPEELRDKLKDKCQLWIISQAAQHFSEQHYKYIKDFFDSGHGLYIWGDNDPLNASSNFILKKLFGAHLSGDYYAMQILSIQNRKGEPGIIENHLISTGIVSFFEGDTIAKVDMGNHLQPLIYSSDKNVVTAYYDKNSKRAIVDGAFTRLWDNSWGKCAGTARYIVNAAAWLANIERFGYKQ